MNQLRSLLSLRLRQARVLNLDVVLGAMLSAWAAWKLPDGHSQPRYTALLLLSLTVWLIYTIDRLLDIRKPDQPPTPRHQFHNQHQRLLWRVAVGVGVLCVGLVYTLPAAVVLFGLKLLALVAIYLLIVSRIPQTSPWQYAKEPLTALAYTAGVWGPPLVAHPPENWVDWALCLMFSGVVVQNLLLFSLFEAKLQSSANNLSTWWGPGFSTDVLMVVFMLVSVGGVFTTLAADFPYQRRMGLIVWGMAGLLWSMTFRPAYFARYERYRWLGDGVFLAMGLLV